MKCELCPTWFKRATDDIAAVVERDNELLTACLSCLGKVLLGEVAGRVVHA